MAVWQGTHTVWDMDSPCTRVSCYSSECSYACHLSGSGECGA